jgi:hypothetical protein
MMNLYFKEGEQKDQCYDKALYVLRVNRWRDVMILLCF